MSKSRRGGLAAPTAAALVVCALAGTALAQQQGTYTGHTKNNEPVTVVVGYDTGTGNYTVTGVGFDFVQNCAKDKTYVALVGIGTGGDDQVINGKFSYKDEVPYEYIPFKITFHGTEKLSGTVSNLSAAFNPPAHYKIPPKNFQLCQSDEPFTATFSSSKPVDIPPGIVIKHLGD